MGVNIEQALKTPGFMAEGELAYLAGLAQTSHSIVEIGSWSGRSARAFADNTPGLVFCVDTWADNAYGSAPAEMTCHPDWLWNEFHKNVGNLNHVTAWRMTSLECAAKFADQGFTFDLIFIDAGHNYEDLIADINAWRPLLEPGGVLCGHDYYTSLHHPGVMRAVNELIPKFRVVDGTTIWTTEEV